MAVAVDGKSSSSEVEEIVLVWRLLAFVLQIFQIDTYGAFLVSSKYILTFQPIFCSASLPLLAWPELAILTSFWRMWN